VSGAKQTKEHKHTMVKTKVKNHSPQTFESSNKTKRFVAPLSIS
jgi:hypothetical protein